LLGPLERGGEEARIDEGPRLRPSSDLDLILRSIRDLFSDEVEKLVIDDERAEFERVRAFVEQPRPS